jgi:hypothetical protein
MKPLLALAKPVLGYIAACFLAAAAYVVAKELGVQRYAVGNFATGTTYWVLGLHSVTQIYSLAYFVALIGLPIAIPVIILAEFRKIRCAGIFMSTGLLIALLIKLSEKWFEIRLLANRPELLDIWSTISVALFVLALICGALGGLAYWALAGKTSGNWKLSGQAET